MTILFPPSVFAEEVSVSARVDRTEIYQGESLIFEVSISGLGQEAPKIRMGSLEGFKVVSTGQSQQVQVRAGKVDQTMTLAYTLAALEPGDRTLGPVQVEVQGKRLETRPVEVKVLPGPAPEPDQNSPWQPELEGEVTL